MKTVFVVLISCEKSMPEGRTEVDTRVESCWAIEENAQTRLKNLLEETSSDWGTTCWIEKTQVGDLLIN